MKLLAVMVAEKMGARGTTKWETLAATLGAVAVGQSTTTEKFLKAATYIDPSIEIRCDMAVVVSSFRVNVFTC